MYRMTVLCFQDLISFPKADTAGVKGIELSVGGGADGKGGGWATLVVNCIYEVFKSLPSSETHFYAHNEQTKIAHLFFTQSFVMIKQPDAENNERIK